MKPRAFGLWSRVRPRLCPHGIISFQRKGEAYSRYGLEFHPANSCMHTDPATIGSPKSRHLTVPKDAMDLSADGGQGQDRGGRDRTCNFGSRPAGDNSPVPRPQCGVSTNSTTPRRCARLVVRRAAHRENSNIGSGFPRGTIFSACYPGELLPGRSRRGDSSDAAPTWSRDLSSRPLRPGKEKARRRLDRCILRAFP